MNDYARHQTLLICGMLAGLLASKIPAKLPDDEIGATCRKLLSAIDAEIVREVLADHTPDDGFKYAGPLAAILALHTAEFPPANPP